MKRHCLSTLALLIMIVLAFGSVDTSDVDTDEGPATSTDSETPSSWSIEDDGTGTEPDPDPEPLTPEEFEAKVMEASARFDEDAKYVGQWRADTPVVGGVVLTRIYLKGSIPYMEQLHVARNGDISTTKHKLVAVLEEGEQRFVWETNVNEYVAGGLDPEYFVVDEDGNFRVCGLDTGVFEIHAPHPFGESSASVTTVDLESIDFVPVSELSYEPGTTDQISQALVKRLRRFVLEARDLYHEVQAARRRLSPCSDDPDELRKWGIFIRAFHKAQENLDERVQSQQISDRSLDFQVSMLVQDLETLSLNLAFGETEQYEQRSSSIRRRIDGLLDKLRELEKASARGEFRIWEDSTGEFSVRARYVKRAMDTVTLETRDGETVDVSVDRLSEEDQEYLESR